MYLSGLRPLHLCGTRLEGGHQGLSRRYGQLEGEPVAWCRHRSRPPPEHQGDAEARAGTRWRVPGCRRPSSRLRRRVGIPECLSARVSACLRACRRCRRALARPTRTSGSGRVFGAHPRGEFRTSGAAVGQIRARAASAAFPHRTRRTCLSSEGGHRRLCAATSGHRRLCAVTSLRRHV